MGTYLLKEVKRLQMENECLRKAVSDLTLDKLILKETAIRSDDGPEFIAETVRDELLNGEIPHSLREAQIVIEQSRIHCNAKRPHSALGHRPQAPETIIPMDQPAMN